jgi:hypothetical protein
MKAGRVVQASVMVGCYDLQCKRSADGCTLQPYCTRQGRTMPDIVDMDAAGHGMRDLERPRP